MRPSGKSFKNVTTGFKSAQSLLIFVIADSPPSKLAFAGVPYAGSTKSHGLPAAAPTTWLRSRQLLRKSMSNVYELEHCPSASARGGLPNELHCLVWSSAYRTPVRFSLFIRCGSRFGNDSEQHGIRIIERQVAFFGVPPDCFLIEKPFWVLFEDASMLLFQLGPHPTHD
jgi:hypothetical protein